MNDTIGTKLPPQRPNSPAVLVVGAGPTGLTLARELARRGVTFRLIEAAPGPQPGSRGKGFQPRTLEVFGELGIVEPQRRPQASGNRLRGRDARRGADDRRAPRGIARKASCRRRGAARRVGFRAHTPFHGSLARLPWLRAVDGKPLERLGLDEVHRKLEFGSGGGLGERRAGSPRRMPCRHEQYPHV